MSDACERCLRLHAGVTCDDGWNHHSALPYPQAYGPWGKLPIITDYIDIPPESAGAAPREWQAWQIMDGVQLDAMRSDELFIEHAAYLALERKFQETYESENRRIVELQAKLNHCAVTGAAVAKERDVLAAQLAEAERKLRVSNACDSAAQERIASLEAERDRLRGALEKIAAGGTVTRRMCEDIAQAALKAEPTDWQGPTQAEIAHAMRPGQGVD